MSGQAENLGAMLKGFLKGFRSLVKGESNDWNFEDRRRIVRLRCHYDVKAETNGKKFDATIVDMGLKGLRLRCFQALKVGSLVKVATPVPIVGAEAEEVVCEVVWNKQPERNFVTFAGMVYKSDDKTMGRSWVKYFLKELGFSQELIYSKRRHVRAECFMEGKLVLRDGTPHKVRLYNLGVGGALVELGQALELQQTVELQVGPYEELPPFVASGKLVKVKKEGKLSLYGLEFGDLAGSEVKILGRYLQHLLKSSWCE